MKKNYLLAVALAIMTMASCSDNDFVGDQRALNAEREGAISFDLNTPAMTRGEVGGATAATALNNEFIIWGEKNEADGTAAAAANQVFYNYKVDYTSNSAYTTTSNTKNWEYVGLTPYTSDKVSPALTVDQTIKYWDYSATSYTFTAVSALPTDISGGKVVITKNTSGSTVYDKGYEIAVKTDASLDDIFIADRNQPTTGTGTDRNATNTYGGNVTMKFRNFMSKIRFGLYETIPGYKVNITNVEYNSTGSSSTSKFGVDGKFLTAGANTVFTVTYGNGTTTGPENKAIVDVKGGTTPNDQAYLETAQDVAGSPILSTSPASPVSTVITSPTYDKTAGAYTTILPYSSNTTNMKVKFDFTLTSEDTGETITVSDATAEIPSAYCQWKSNYAYTYILKLNDNTNGQISGVTGLYPITFDAVQIEDENGQAEYITTVSEPSITTFGVNSSTGKYVTGGSEYAAGSDIYATIMDGSSVKDFTLGTDVNVYLVTTTDAANFPITEASVAEALAEISTGSKKITYVNENTNASSKFTAVPVEVTTVPGEDGVDITGTHALKLTGAAATIETTAYAIEYIKTAATYHTETVEIADQAALTAYLATGKLYTNATGTTEASATFDGGTTYYRRTAVDNVGTYAYKVIRVN